MINPLRLASVLVGIPVISTASWWFITLAQPVKTWGEFLCLLLVFLVWQAYVIYSVIFLLLRALIVKYWMEALLSSILGSISGTLGGFSVAGHAGLLFGFLIGPLFGLLFGLAVGGILRRNSDPLPPARG